MERESLKSGNTRKMRCDFAYGAFLISSIGFLASSIWLRTTDEVALEKGGINIFSLPAYLALLLVFPVLGVGAGAVAFPHPPALALGCVCLVGLLCLFNKSPTSEAMIPFIAFAALATSLWWFILGRRKFS